MLYRLYARRRKTLLGSIMYNFICSALFVYLTFSQTFGNDTPTCDQRVKALYLDISVDMISKAKDYFPSFLTSPRGLHASCRAFWAPALRPEKAIYFNQTKSYCIRHGRSHHRPGVYGYRPGNTYRSSKQYISGDYGDNCRYFNQKRPPLSPIQGNTHGRRQHPAFHSF
ncbi:hypothetical protein CDAR_216481 [Caerostris darwini]|uniref:Uncharacterized protein n=1 Tax=Caerostris darwini TaxID=1538125 RepID=A0AAV4NW82_9ARAC|nr:hypothetical protein CDAR_216481 [Caerostris darwini]